ncbi:MAG TPA: hypothetical protein GXZ98_00370 [Firmicutes bacterium]|jgi:sugar (pentulose or hexulose) kinase|nr:hypothetical protein [Bacillota bacterium]
MAFISIDLGTTNIKVAIFDDQLRSLVLSSHEVKYDRRGDLVEFDVENYVSQIAAMIRQIYANTFPDRQEPIHQIVLTGQAESLVLVDQTGKPLRPAISWLDMRSRKECQTIANTFDAEKCYRITGQPEIIPTWPITKLLWLREHETSIFKQAAKYLLLKDYVVHYLTGMFVGEYSIYSFSHYFDLRNKKYWAELLEFADIPESKLPELVPPCTVVGNIIPKLQQFFGIPGETKVNIGTLDHFAGMIGTGNIKEGSVSESAGTVLSIAAFIDRPLASDAKIPIYCGPFPNTYVLLPVCESGGISLEWFKNNFMPNEDYKRIDAIALERIKADRVMFLPYITGVNPPEFNPHARGVFFGAKAEHDRYDFCLAIMEGVSFLLRKNIDHLKKAGVHINTIISTGGGAKSALWSQLKANISNHTVLIPETEEAPSLGSAIIGAVSEGIFNSYESAIGHCVKIKKAYQPNEHHAFYEQRFRFFEQLYTALIPLYKQYTETNILL